MVDVKTQQEEYKNNFLYSQEYFDYLIEYASIIDFEAKEEEKQKNKINQKEITLNNDDTNIFKLKIETGDIKTYKEVIKSENAKTLIPVTKKLNVMQDVTKNKNKYNSNDYKLKTGIKYSPINKFIVNTGIETTLRGQDQNPVSKKLLGCQLTKEFNLLCSGS